MIVLYSHIITVAASRDVSLDIRAELISPVTSCVGLQREKKNVQNDERHKKASGVFIYNEKVGMFKLIL